MKRHFSAMCPACGHSQRPFFRYRGFDYHRCPACGTVSTLPLPDDQLIREHYKQRFSTGNYRLTREHEKDYALVFDSVAGQLKRQMERLGKKMEGGRILDIGCFTGGFMASLSGLGAQAFGVELQEEAVAIASQRMPGRVFQADVREMDFPGGGFDAVTLLGVIEHVADPAGLLKQCFSLLKPGGILLIQTPASDSFLARIMGRFWPPYEPVEHIHLFSRKGLALALEREGFKAVSSKRQVKRISVEYVYNNLKNFGPEIHALASPFYRSLPTKVKRSLLPFYVGGVTMFCTRP